MQKPIYAWLKAIESKAKGPERQFRDQLEDCFCNDARYSLAEEKFGSEFQKKLPMAMQQDLAILSEERRMAGLPALSSRQKLCWALRHYSKDDLRDQNAAWNAMQALRDAVKATPPARHAFKKLIQALDSNLTMESASEISESEKLNLLEDMMSVIPDFSTQFEFHLEAPRSERTYANLKARIQELVDRDQRKTQRDQQQQQFSKQL